MKTACSITRPPFPSLYPRFLPGVLSPKRKDGQTPPLRRLFSLAVYSIALSLQVSCAGTREYTDEADHYLRPQVVAAAMAMRGAPYTYGGSTPQGFDCSGLVQYSYQQGGIVLPRSSYKQFKASRPIYERDLKPGDLVFFRTTSALVSHVGIYIGNGKFVHAPGQGKTVRVSSMDEDYYRKRFAGAGRFF